MRRSTTFAAAAVALPMVLGFTGGSPARAQVPPDPADVAGADTRWRQRAAMEPAERRRWQPRSGSWQDDRGYGSGDPRRSWQERRPSPRPYWYDRWARSWPYPGYAGSTADRRIGWRGEGLWHGTKGFVPAGDPRDRRWTGAPQRWPGWDDRRRGW